MIQKKKKKKKIPDKKAKKNKFGKKPKSKPSGKKKYFFGKITKIFLAGSAALSILYLALGFAAGNGILKKDLQDKYGKVLGAVNVSALVIGRPVKPTVTDTPGCSSSYPFIDLDWADDLGSDTYDVWRDGNLLVSGRAASNYRDNNVNLSTTHVYYVVANGPYGVEQSDEISTTTETECYVPPILPPEPPPPPPPPASLLISTLDSMDLANWVCSLKTNKKNPTFSGTSNISQALVQVEIQSGKRKREVISSLHANGNGYWIWRSQGKLKKGSHRFYISVVDSDDASRSASSSLAFQVSKKKPSKKTIKKCTRRNSLFSQTLNSSFPTDPLVPNLLIGGQSRVVHSGENLKFEVSGRDLNTAVLSSAPYQLTILDSKGNPIPVSDNSYSEKGELKISEKIPPGKYTLSANYSEGGLDVSAQDNFEIREIPLLVLGNGREITYRQILGNLGWAALLSLGVLGIFILLLLLEHHLSKRAFFQVTETDLKGRGMID